MEFPTSISDRDDRIAALVSVHDNSEAFHLQWLVIKKIQDDKVERVIDLVDLELASKLEASCDNGLSSCIYKDQVEQRLRTANAALSRYSWRAFPCYRKQRTGGLTRFEPGCERFRDLTVRFKDPWLLVSLHGRTLLNQQRHAWAYRGQSCKKYMETSVESFAFDPETSIFVVGVSFSAPLEGCDVPIWELHPIRAPQLAKDLLPERDGGAP
jgi:hypothetical protein